MFAYIWGLAAHGGGKLHEISYTYYINKEELNAYSYPEGKLLKPSLCMHAEDKLCLYLFHSGISELFYWVYLLPPIYMSWKLSYENR